MKFILFTIFYLFIFTPPTFSHGSNEDCSNECNDYYCPPEMKKDKENQSKGIK
mgnify:FL=1